ncbi:unnamed protein product [Calypogeia fissa]
MSQARYILADISKCSFGPLVRCAVNGISFAVVLNLWATGTLFLKGDAWTERNRSYLLGNMRCVEMLCARENHSWIL